MFRIFPSVCRSLISFVNAYKRLFHLSSFTTSVPDAVWDLNVPLPPESGNTTVDLSRTSDDYRWWETQPITRLVLTSNLLTSIPPSGLIKLNTLTQIDVSYFSFVLVPRSTPLPA